MQEDVVRIALASFVNGPGPFVDWEKRVIAGLGDLSAEFKAIVQLASILSSGGTEAAGKIQHLGSIFDKLSLDEKRTEPRAPTYYALRSLSLQEEALFPSKSLEQADPAALGKLWNGLAQALPGRIEITEPGLESVQAALQRYAVNVPSSQAGVSFYDQKRITAAIAVCLLKKDGDAIRKTLEALGRGDKSLEEPVALLVGGDLSGIQEFIYTITAKGAAKSLRGRSFYLQLLTEAILRFVLRELELPYTNVIYSGGGHFFLLAPVAKAGELTRIQRRITEALSVHHRNSLYLALGSAEVRARDFFDGRFPEKWGEMHRALSLRKQQRYGELGADMYAQVFAVREFGGNPDQTCSVCKEDHRKSREWDDLDTQERICTLCDSFIEEIGRKLPKSDFIALGFGAAPTGKNRSASDALAEFGMSVQFIEETQAGIGINGGQTVLWALDDPESGKWPAAEGAPRWMRYTANHVTLDSFDELQKKVAGGFERLGVLRMDVDNLGELFKRGLGKEATLAQLATLSFRISLFFEGWLKRLCETGNRKELIYTVYAGGDDVFLIGPWDVMPHLAREIVANFAQYTGGNPYLHASAGMTFIDGKYPVYQAAEDARDALEDAKSVDGKNAFTFLGKPWPWPAFEKVTAKFGKLDNLIKTREADKKAAPRALLQILQQLALQEEQHKDRKVKGRHVWGRWIWMGMYQLTRMSELNKATAAEIKSIRDELKESNYLEIDQWGIAARWTELHERKKSKKEDEK